MNWQDSIRGVTLKKWNQFFEDTMPSKKDTLSVQGGRINVMWDECDNMTISRTDTGAMLEVSSSEWILILKIADLRGWPTSPPYHGRDDKGYED